MYLASNRYCVNWFENCIKINEHFNSFERLASNFSLEYYPGINVEVTRVTEMITDHTNSHLFYKFSLSEPQEMYREQYGEYAYWC